MVSVIITIFMMLTNKYIDVDIFKSMEKYNEMIENLKNSGFIRVANFFDYIIDEATIGNKIPAFIFIFFIYNIPILNIILLIDRIKKILNRDEKEN